jgi:hypothetical protein
MSAAALDSAIELIRKHVSMRTPALAEALGIGEAAVDAMLHPARAAGALNTCEVEAGGRRVVEYRCSASGGKYTAYASPRRNQTRQDPSSAAPAPRDRAQPQPAAETKGENEVNLTDRITAAFKEHGPMTIGKLLAHVEHQYVPDFVRQMAGRGVLAKLGGKTRGVIYGLPDQQAPAVEPEAPEAAAEPDRKKRAPRHIHKKKRKKAAPKARKRRLKRTPRLGSAIAKAAARKAWKTRRANAERLADKNGAKAAKFRPALLADGALLFLGAERGEFEIGALAAKAIVDLVRALTPEELTAAAEFIARLDGGKVAA